MADDDFVPCLFSAGKECRVGCENRRQTDKTINDELQKKKKSRRTFAALWRTDPMVGPFSKMMQRARPKAYAACLNRPKQ